MKKTKQVPQWCYNPGLSRYCCYVKWSIYALRGGGVYGKAPPGGPILYSFVYHYPFRMPLIEQRYTFHVPT